MTKPDPSSNHQLTMADLMAQAFNGPLSLRRGDEVTGTVTAITDSEIVLDVGAKAEGSLSKKDLTASQLENVKVGDSLTAFVAIPETDTGQAVLTAHKSLAQTGRRFNEQVKKWQKFFSALERQTAMLGQVREVNKGGLVVEVDGTRGFLPASQIAVEHLSGGKEQSAGLSGLVGKEIRVSVIEVDPGDGRLIFSTRKKLTEGVLGRLANMKTGEIVSGKIAGFTPFGLIVDIEGLEGVVYSQEASWEEVEDLSGEFSLGQVVEAKVIGVDESLGRLNLSIKQLSADPLASVLEKFEPDDVVQGTIKEITSQGVTVKLEGGVDGFLPVSSDMRGEYGVGQMVSLLVDNVDQNKRRVNLAPFLTSTKGLIYK